MSVSTIDVPHFHDRAQTEWNRQASWQLVAACRPGARRTFACTEEWTSTVHGHAVCLLEEQYVFLA